MKNWVFAFAVVFTSSDVWAGGDPPDFVLAWGSNGTGDGQFGGAHGIEVDADGNVYVSDTGNNRIQKFTSDGVFLTKWGTFGTGPGQFSHPHGIGIGPMGNVYVAETGNNRVQKFTSDGTFITMWGLSGTETGSFGTTMVSRWTATGTSLSRIGTRIAFRSLPTTELSSWVGELLGRGMESSRVRMA